jgi:hypothetical protein
MKLRGQKGLSDWTIRWLKGHPRTNSSSPISWPRRPGFWLEATGSDRLDCERFHRTGRRFGVVQIPGCGARDES